MYYTWNTKKQNNTYIYIVKKEIPTNEIQIDGTYSITTIEKKGICQTRHQAVQTAKKWVRYLKNQ